MQPTELEAQLKNVIGYLGVTGTLKLFSQVCEQYADVRAAKQLPVGSCQIAASGLLELAEKFERERQFENFQMGDFKDFPY